jgi:glycosyltransferase involved in cell wall biosynthesis
MFGSARTLNFTIHIRKRAIWNRLFLIDDGWGRWYGPAMNVCDVIAGGHPLKDETAPCQVVSTTHVVIIPSFNSGRLLSATVVEARLYWAPVWIVIDGSNDGSAADAEALAKQDPAIRLLQLPRNRGKGAAVLVGLIAARASGFSHILVMDADAQHPADHIPIFMATSADNPTALVMGRPLFGADAPWIRVAGRRLSNWCAAAETSCRVGDTLFGFRVYPVEPLIAAMQASRGMRRFDFDPEAVVRLAWSGVPLIHLDAPVRYLSREEGGISHFDYVRDNWLLIGMHLRLGLSAIGRIARLLTKTFCLRSSSRSGAARPG